MGGKGFCRREGVVKSRNAEDVPAVIRESGKVICQPRLDAVGRDVGMVEEDVYLQTAQSTTTSTAHDCSKGSLCGCRVLPVVQEDGRAREDPMVILLFLTARLQVNYHHRSTSHHHQTKLASNRGMVDPRILCRDRAGREGRSKQPTHAQLIFRSM